MTAIKNLRIKKGISQDALAKLLGTTQAAVAMWETGARMPRADKLPRLAEVLGCTVSDLSSVPWASACWVAEKQGRKRCCHYGAFTTSWDGSWTQPWAAAMEAATRSTSTTHTTARKTFPPLSAHGRPGTIRANCWRRSKGHKERRPWKK